MGAALRDADRLKDEFLAMLAHELRNPLAAILGAVRLLGLKGPVDPDGSGAGTSSIARPINSLG